MCLRMSPAASFGERWARDNLDREASTEEIQTLDLFPATCGGDVVEAAKRARKYYTARGSSGLTELWHKSHPDDEDILSSCQDAYIVPLRSRSVGGRRMTLVRLPAPTALDRPLCARAFLSRWLMILDIRLREDPTPGEEVVFIDVCDLQPSHLKKHFRGSYWKDFVWCMKSVYPIRFSEVHIINTHRLKTMSLLLLHIGLYPWRRKIVHLHTNGEQINNAMAVDHFPIEGLPYEYGGKAGAMKDLNENMAAAEAIIVSEPHTSSSFISNSNEMEMAPGLVATSSKAVPAVAIKLNSKDNLKDEWTKKLLLNSKWLQMENRKFYQTDLMPQIKQRTRHRSAVRNLYNTNASYDMLPRTSSCRSLYKKEDPEEGTHGAYRTLKVTDRHFYV